MAEPGEQHITVSAGQETLLLWRLPSTGRELRFPIYLSLERDEAGGWVVSDQVLYAYGVGVTLAEALEDYEAMLLDAYEQLEENADRLSSRPRRQLTYLRSLLG